MSLPKAPNLFVVSLAIGAACYACGSDEAPQFRASTFNAQAPVPNLDAQSTASFDAGKQCPSLALAWTQSVVLGGLPASPGAVAWTPDGLVAAVVNADNGDGLELYERAALSMPFVRLQFLPSGYIDGAKGMSLSESGTTLLGVGYKQNALTALQRAARGATFVAATDTALTANYNQTYPKGFVETTRPSLLTDGSIVAFTRSDDGQGGITEKFVWLGSDGKDRSDKLPPKMRSFLGASTLGPQIAWSDIEGRAWISRTALGEAYAPVAYLSADHVSLLDPCVGAAARVPSEAGFSFALFEPQGAAPVATVETPK